MVAQAAETESPEKRAAFTNRDDIKDSEEFFGSFSGYETSRLFVNRGPQKSFLEAAYPCGLGAQTDGRAVAAFDLYSRHGLAPDAFAYSGLISAAGKCGDLRSAEAALRRAVTEGACDQAVCSAMAPGKEMNPYNVDKKEGAGAGKYLVRAARPLAAPLAAP